MTNYKYLLCSLCLVIASSSLTQTQLVKKHNGPLSPRADPPSVNCLDTLEEFDSGRWSSYPDRSIYFAAGDSDLPEGIQGKFPNVSTVFYKEGYGSTWGSNFAFSDSTWNAPDPSYIYLKYYAHLVNETEHTMSAVPALYPDDLDDPNGQPHQKYLRKGYNFQWTQEIVPAKLQESYVYQLLFSNFERNEYFLIDRMAVIQGHPLGSFNDVNRLCGWPEEEGGEKFVCLGEGSFADPLDNTQYHVCVSDGQGGFTDNVLTCPATTVWCQKYERCDTEDVCFV